MLGIQQGLIYARDIPLVQVDIVQRAANGGSVVAVVLPHSLA